MYELFYICLILLILDISFVAAVDYTYICISQKVQCLKISLGRNVCIVGY